MIDTMQLLLTDYEVRDAKLKLQPSPVDTETGAMTANFPLWHDGARAVEGAYAYHRDEHFNVKISPQPMTGGLGMGTACYVRFEVPKFAGGNNYHPVDRDGTAQALRDAQNRLKSVGILTNIKAAQISRMDAFTNVVALEPYSNYQPVLALLSGTRMEQRGYENGFLWENGRQQVCVYDKLEKMKRDKLVTAGLPKNSIRFEWRALKSAKVRETLGFGTVKEMLVNHGHVRTVYNEVMKKQLFSHSVADVEAVQTGQILEDMKYFYASGGRNWMQRYLNTVGLTFLLDKAPLDVIVGALDDVVDDKVKRSRLKKQLRQARRDASFLQLLPGASRTTGELYEELREKVLSV
jgi:hypothetical protein